MKADYHVHALGHLEYRHTEDHLQRIFTAAQAAGVEEIGLADHDEYAQHFQHESIQKAAARFPELQVRQGVEVDYRLEKEKEIQTMLAAYPYDFAMGSVHTVAGWPFDHPDYRDGYDAWDADELYVAYYQTVAQAAQSGLFDIMGHLDLIKVFGCRPTGDRVKLARPALEAIRDNHLCVEVNSNGWYKPVGEVYPEAALLQECWRMEIPVTTGSDAHAPEQVGRDLDRVLTLLCKVGYTTVTLFESRNPRQVPMAE